MPAGGRQASGSDPGFPFGFSDGRYFIAHDSHSLDDPFSFKIIEHEVLSAAVVPHRDGSLGPAITDSEPGICYPSGQVSEQRITFKCTHLHNSTSKMFVDIK